MKAPHRTGARRARLLPALLLAATLALAAAPAARAGVARAIVDTGLFTATSEERARSMAEIGQQLRARWVRLEVQWPRIEPQRGVYDETYLAGVEEQVDLARANGVKVMLTFLYTPKWASDTTLYDEDGEPPYLYTPGVYQPFYAPRVGTVDDFGAMVAHVATRLAGKVAAYEAWNEPNLWVFFYPQQIDDPNTKGTVEDPDFAVRRYAQLLRACSSAVRAADPGALVVAGSTSPIGEGDAANFNRYRTRPAYWAQALMRMGLRPYFDAYAHHPYMPGPNPRAPEAAPLNPDTTVTLRNLGTLLDIVPEVPFFLTEYGYNTARSDMFGVTTGLTQAQQADYLRRAYRYAARYTRVKALFWYLRRDHSPSGKASDARGVFTGLRTVTNARKRSWFTFAGGMKLTLSAASPIRSGAYTRLSGTLTCSRLATATSNGGLSGKQLEVQRRVNGTWQTLKTTKSGSGGRYTSWVRLYRDTRLRVVWRGVVASPTRFVDTR